eukprot:10628223-Ditylum_brightwellii.AAC.1
MEHMTYHHDSDGKLSPSSMSSIVQHCTSSSSASSTPASPSCASLKHHIASVDSLESIPPTSCSK